MRRQGTLKRWTAILLAVMLMLSSGLSGLAEAMTEMASTEKYEQLAEEIMQQASTEPTVTAEGLAATQEPAPVEVAEEPEATQETAPAVAAEEPAATQEPAPAVAAEEPEATQESVPDEAAEEPEATQETAPVEATEEPAVTQEPAPVEAMEERVLNEVTEEPASSETPQEPETTEEPTPIEAESEAESVEMPEENLHFSAGYVCMEKGSAIYERVQGEAWGTLAADGIVYAELAQEAEDSKNDWLKITFDTQSLREDDADFAEGYVRYKQVEALTEEETQKLVEGYEKDAEIRWDNRGKFYVPCVAFEENADNADVQPQDAVEAGENEAVVDVASDEDNEEASASENGEEETEASEVEAAVSEIIGVWYDKGIEEQPLKIHVTTGLDAQVLYLYQGDELLSSWQASEAEIDEYATCKEWHVSYTFAYSGKYYLWYRTSADGTAMSAAYTPDPVQIERPAVIDVWYEKGVEGKPLKIHVTTNLDMNNLYMYLGDDELGSWNAEDVEITEYATCKEWVIEHTFADPGKYYLWYKASEDGEELSLPYSPEAAQIERPAVIEVWYEKGVEGKPLKIHATTNLQMQQLYLYLGENQLGSWNAEDAEITEYATCKEWVIEHTFEEPGKYYLWYKASEDGETLSQAYAPAAAQIERPAIIEVWYESAVTDEPVAIHVTTNLDMQYLYLYLGENQLDAWQADEATIAEYATCKEWTVEHTFEDAGAYYLWYKASKDGTTEELPFAPDPVNVEQNGNVPDATATPEPTIEPTPEPTIEPTATPCVFFATISCSAEKGVVGESVTWTGSAVNGTEPYKYLFKLYKDEKLLKTRAYSDDSTYTYTFTEAGEYYVVLSIKDDDLEVVTVNSDIVTVGVETLRVSEVVCDVENIQTAQMTTWTAAAEGGQAPYTYAFVLTKDEATVAEQACSNLTAFSYEFTEAGDYTLAVTVKDDLGTVSEPCELAVTVAQRPFEIVSLEADASAGETEEAITWTVEVKSGETPYTYAFELVVDGVSQGKGESQSEPTFTYTPEVAGTYSVIAYATDANGTTLQKQSDDLVVATKTLAISAVEANEIWVEVGETITWTNTAVGGVKPLRYAFDIYLDGEELGGASYSNENTLSYTAETAGVYTVTALVRDANNTTVSATGGEVVVFSEEGSPAEDFTFNALDDTYCEITGYTGMNAIVKLPAKDSEGRIVERIAANAFENNTTISCVVVPEGVKTVDVDAFSGAKSLTTIELPSTLTTIGGLAFYGCTSLESISLPDSVETIGEYAFSGCTGLSAIYIGANVTSIGSNAFEDCSSDLVIYGKAGSYAETFAEENGFAFSTRTMTPNDESDFTTELLDDGTVEITGYSGERTDVVIPRTIGGATVTSIGSDAFSGNEDITSVKLPDSLTSIGEAAFKGCTSLETMTVPNAVTRIDGEAFKGCTSLKTINLPDSLTEIGYDVVADCTSLETLDLPDSITELYGICYGCSSLKAIRLPDSLTNIGYCTFYGCTGLETLDLPDSLKTIGDYAFYECGSLKEINLPNSLESIGGKAFAYCASLKTIEMPDSVTSLGNDAFERCTSLETIQLSNSLTKIGDEVFSWCTSLKSIELPDSVESIGEWAFYSADLQEISIPESVQSIDSSAFDNCPNLVIYGEAGSYAETFAEENGFAFSTRTMTPNDESDFTTELLDDGTVEITGYSGARTDVVIPRTIGGATVTSIGSDAFSGNEDITSVKLPDSLTILGEFAFENCKSLMSVDLPDSLTSIGGYAFHGCVSLTTIELPASLTRIGETAFRECTCLTVIELPASLTQIGNYAFEGCKSLTTLTLPASLAYLGSGVFSGCSELQNIRVAEENESFVAVDGALFTKDMKTLKVYPGASEKESYTVPDGVEIIDEKVFSGCTKLKTIQLSDTVQKIEWAAFDGCSGLTTITLPDSLTNIGESAFRDCANLEAIKLPDSITCISGAMFWGCTSLKKVELSDSITYIDVYAFMDCTSLEMIELPDSVAEIIDRAFAGCTSLTAIYIGPNVKYIEEDAFENCSSELVIYGKAGSYAETYAKRDGITFSTETMDAE